MGNKVLVITSEYAEFAQSYIAHERRTFLGAVTCAD
jgi:hypothetical protein